MLKLGGHVEHATKTYGRTPAALIVVGTIQATTFAQRRTKKEGLVDPSEVWRTVEALLLASGTK